MYADFKSLGLKNRDVATILIDTERKLGGTPMSERIESPSMLSRTVVHTAPGEVPAVLLRDFSVSIPKIVGCLVTKLKSNGVDDVAGFLTERYRGPSAKAMQNALTGYGIDAAIYRNALARIANLGLVNEIDSASLYLMLFVATGCTGDPHAAVRDVEQYAKARMGASFRTPMSTVDLDGQDEVDGGKATMLGLARIVGGKLKGPDGFYRLNPAGRGTEIGILSSGDGAINDVDEDVSRRHARVYCENTHWYVVGLGSTNGTTVISGTDKIERVVEPPKRERPRDYAPEPFEIFPADTLCLGSSTRFMVIPIQEEDRGEGDHLMAAT